MKILFCDDEKSILDLYINEMEYAFPDYTFYRAENGQTAIELIKEHNIPYVFTDGQMPVMDGIALAKELQKLENPPVIYMITGFAGTYDEKSLIGSGIEQVFYKPVDYDWLTDFIKELK